VTQLAPGSPQRTGRGSDPGAHHDLHPVGHHVGGPDQRRGRHATSLGQGFEWMVGWSILGTLIPGSGLMAAGRRQLGLAVLGVSLCLLSGLAVLSILTDPVALALGFAVNGSKLLILAGAVVLAALLMVTVVLSTHFSLRRVARLTRTQQLFSSALVAGLVAMVLVPAAKVTSYTLIQRDLVSSVFANGARDTNAVRPNTSKADPWASIPRVNVLLIGSDAGADRTSVRTDTMIVASINTKTGDTVLFSLPRNLEHAPFADGTPGADAWPDGYYCNRPSDPCWLNSVWVWAEGDGAKYYPKSKYRQPGLAATEDAIHGVTGLKIDYYAMLNLRGFSSFVNALGGVDVNVPERLPIGGNSSNHSATSGWIEAGQHQHLDGYQALWFARSRWSTDDYDRMRRQRCVIGAIAAQANPANLAKAFPALAAAAKDNIETSIQQSDLEAWVDLTMRVKKAGSIRSLPFTSKVVGSTANPDYDQIHRLVDNALVDPSTSSTSHPSASGSAGSDPSASPSPSKSSDLSTKAGRAATDSETAQNVNEVC
jgi:polyisoprenyl-teichoic acid--peptidoglycan teichoic acid transferase